MSTSPANAFVALGANLGDRAANLRDALAQVGATGGVEVVAVSSFLENPAVGGPAGSPAFLNAVAHVRTTLAPRELLSRLLEIEKNLGRQRREKWGPRVIDLDLLIVEDQVVCSEDLIVPHPRLHERYFVLKPLAEIAPGLVVPGINRTVKELLEALNGQS